MSDLQHDLLELSKQPRTSGSISKVIIRLCAEIENLKKKLKIIEDRVNDDR